ncbi:SusC/RagA family TonB-linked outer membrane protein [Parapedobacter deserti]|uniref:SusC/RagA family TonB-linked outer membrane protein n=1 Tax=Parapedobacter deserti TaxID=1912957 RepID=A0ABV7JRK7_9SPHI
MNLRIPLARKVMRVILITTISIISASQFLMATDSYGQLLEKRVDLTCGSTDAFTIILEIQRTTGVDFAFTNSLGLEKINYKEVRFKNQKLGTVLSSLFEDKHIGFVEKAGTIMLHKLQQPGHIQGRVVDQQGNPLAGATVLIVENGKNYPTDTDGRYSAALQPGQYTLEVRYVAYATQRLTPVTVTAGQRVNRDIIMAPILNELAEVEVVTALGIKRKARSLGYAVDEIGSEDMAKVPQENVVNALNGRVTGLRVVNPTSELNSEPFVLIRGYTSLSGNNSPLIVVDGVPTGTDVSVLSDLSADHIESVNVLKGPSAAALYGSRAGNGVLLVTTKKGKDSRGLGIDFNTAYTATVPYQYIPQQQRFANGSNGNFDQTSNLWWGPEMGTEVVRFGSDGASPLTAHPNNVSDFLDVGNSFITNLGVSHHSEKINFSLSLSDTRATGIYPGTNLRKDAVSIFTEYAINERLKVSMNFNYLNSGSDNNRGLSYDNYPYEDLYFTPNWLSIHDLKDYWAEPGASQSTWARGFNNPWFTANENINTFKKIRPYGNIKLDWAITPHLSLMTRIGGFNESYTTQNRTAISEKSFPEGAYAYIGRESQQLNTDFLLNYKKELTDLTINLSAGGNLFFQNNTVSSISGERLELPGLYTAGNIDRAAVQYGVGQANKRIPSLYGLASIGYKNLLFLEVSGRNDWSSTLPEHNRSYFYPSVSLSAIVSDMIRMPAAVDMLKLRGGWAQVGKDTDPYALSMVLSKSTWGGKTTYVLPGTLPTQNLLPESVISSEVGFEADFFGRRLGLDATYYQLENKNQISRISVTGATGFTATNVNAGIVKNNGIEVTLRGVPIRRTNWQWDVAFNFTKESSKLTKLPEGVSNHQFWSRNNIFSQTKVDGTVGDMWGPDVLRVTEGTYKGWPLLDGNGYVQLNPEYIHLGNVNPDYTLGLQTNLSYKRISLSASFDCRQGGEYYSESMKRLARDGRTASWYKGNGSSTFSGILNNHSFADAAQLAEEIRSNPDLYNAMGGLTWVGGRNADLGGFAHGNNELANGAFFPGVISDGNGGYLENFGADGTRYFRADLIADPGAGYWSKGVQSWIYDASFIKLRELTVAYRLPEPLAARLSMRGLTLSWYMRNVILWTKAKNKIDPESTMMNGNSQFSSGSNYLMGFDRASFYPWSMNMGLKLSVQF